MKRRNFLSVIILLITIIPLFFIGCSSGGGGGDNDGGASENPQPEPEVAVAINQIETDCSNPGVTQTTAFVSVIDEYNDPITGLTKSNFSLFEDAVEIPTASFVVHFVEELQKPVSVAFVMDYSNSMEGDGAIEPMEKAVIDFVKFINSDDEAEIIKFTGIYEVVQEFTSDKSLLEKAITDTWEGGRGSVILDAVSKAISDTFERLNRKAVIVITDGQEHDSINTIDEVIEHALSLGIPIFTIGFGRKVNVDLLEELAQKTGGHFYETPSTDDIRTAYQQIADLLVLDQYVIEYESSLQGNVILEVEVEYNDLYDSDSRQYTTCP